MTVKDLTNEEEDESAEEIRLTQEQKKILKEAIDVVSVWVELNQEASASEYKKSQKDIGKHVKRFLENIGLAFFGNILKELENSTTYERDEL